MTQQAFESVTGDLVSAIDSLLRSELRLPALLILYAGIDIMASLNRPESRSEVNPSDFLEWADRYLLHGTHLACSSEDLYGARCGLMHTYTAESRSSRSGKANQIWYAWGTGRVDDLQELIDAADDVPSAVAVHVDDLFHAFRRGVKLFKRSLYDDPKKANLVYERANKFFANMPPITKDNKST